MTPALPDVLRGNVVAISMPLPPEAASDYMGGRLSMLAMLSFLAAQEVETGIAARVWENGAIRTLLGEAARTCEARVRERFETAAAEVDTDLSWHALDAANAGLRRLLIELHEMVEVRGDTALDRRIVELYGRMAQERRLDLAPLFSA
jgi:hypothetical protein